MNDMKLLGILLDLGAEMIRSGAETHRVEDSLYRLCASYRFTECNIWVVPSNIQATVTAPSGECLTQIRHIPTAGIDFERLDRLNDLSRRACAGQPEAEVLREMLADITEEPAPTLMYSLLAGVLSVCGFGIFFNCDAADTIAAFFVSLLITCLVRRMQKKESNPLILNFLIAFPAELFILLAVRAGLGHHPGSITVSAVMLLISALGTTNGLRDMVHLDTISGLVNITISLTGAIGIAMGIIVPLLLLRYPIDNEAGMLSPSLPVTIVGCTVGCIGFALWFHVTGRKLLSCTCGALLTWCLYLLMLRVFSGSFAATLTAAFCCSLYAEIMARVQKAPGTIYRTVCVFPLIPGAYLYRMMCGIVLQNADMTLQNGRELLLICFGIVFGFMAAEVLWKAAIPQNIARQGRPR